MTKFRSSSKSFASFLILSVLIIAVAVQQSQILNLRDTLIEQSERYYTGNPFATGLWSGQLQAENITGMHWYSYQGGSLYNRTDVIINPPHTLAYIVEADGATAHLVNCGTGQRDWSSTDHDAVGRAALGNLTPSRNWLEAVLYLGNLTVDAVQQISAWTKVIISGRINLANNADCNIFENANPATNDAPCVIQGGWLYGNKDNNNYGSGIVWNHTTSPSGNYPTLRLLDISVTHFAVDSIHVNFTGDSGDGFLLMSNVWTRYSNDEGVELVDCSDTVITGHCFLAGNSYGLYVTRGGPTQVSHLYAGPIYLYYTTAFIMTNFQIDVASTDGIQVRASRQCTIGKGRISIFGNGDTSHIGIELWGANCENNSFTDIFIGRKFWTESSQFAYAVREADSNCDRNKFALIDGTDAGTIGIQLTGAGSRAIGCYNGTTWTGAG